MALQPKSPVAYFHFPCYSQGWTLCNELAVFTVKHIYRNLRNFTILSYFYIYIILNKTVKTQDEETITEQLESIIVFILIYKFYLLHKNEKINCNF